jgi:methyltransferase (TIGR00027 family)
MREAKPSLTAIWVSLWRGVERFERNAVVEDPFADRLLPLPYSPILGAARLAPSATRAILRVADLASGGRSRHMALRTRAIDDAVAGAVKNGARQLVLLGAGLDARAWRMPELQGSVVFEVDHPSTQAYKAPRVEGLRPLARDVRFVGVDFEEDDLAQALAHAGLDPKVRAAVVWEGVTMYLSREAIGATLDALARATAPGSVLAMTYSGRHPPALARLVAVAGEPFASTFTPDQAREILREHGFLVTSDESDPEWSERYLRQRTDFSVERLVCASSMDHASAKAEDVPSDGFAG